MIFVGTWRADITFPIQGGSDHSVDTLHIPSEPAIGSIYTLSRHEEVNAGCSFMTDGTFNLTVQSVTQTGFVCTVVGVTCNVSHATCNVSCGAPPPMPNVSFSLSAPDTLDTVGFTPPETFKKITPAITAMEAQIARRFRLWDRKFV